MLEAINGYQSPHQFIKQAYGFYKVNHPDNRSISGRILEYLVCETLVREGVVPFYYQAKFALVPNADFDLVCYDRHYPVVLSMKVSLRERYKQADLEGTALRHVYRNAKCYLITLSDKEVANVSKKIEVGDTAGLDACIMANKLEYSALLGRLKNQTFTQADSIMPITGQVYPASDV